MRGMLVQSLFLQWKATRWVLIPFVVAGFGLPLLALRTAHAAAVRTPFAAAQAVIESLMPWLPLFPMTAGLLGLTIGLATWSWDYRSNHVYALSLPVARWEFALLKFIAGAAVLLLPVAAVLIAALIGTATMDVPDGLHAYPLAFTFRFMLTAFILFAVGFAFAAGTMRTAIWLISAFLAFLIFGSLAVGFASELLGRDDLLTPLDIMNRALGSWPGPFHVLGGNWMPIDV